MSEQYPGVDLMAHSVTMWARAERLNWTDAEAFEATAAWFGTKFGGTVASLAMAVSVVDPESRDRFDVVVSEVAAACAEALAKELPGGPSVDAMVLKLKEAITAGIDAVKAELSAVVTAGHQG